MEHQRKPRAYDLYLVISIAVLSMIVVLMPISLGFMSVIIAIPALFYAPGYAIARLVLLAKRFGAAERLVFIVGLSIAVTVLLGIILNWTPFGLSVVPFTWAGGLVTIACALGAAWHSDQPDALPHLSLRPAQGIWLGLAAVLVIFAFVISVQGTQRYQNTTFTQVWLLPGSAAHMTVGLRNSEGYTESYHVRIMVNSKPVQDWKNVTLATQQSWQQQLVLTAPPGATISAQIFRAEDPAAIYRQATYTLPDTLAATPPPTIVSGGDPVPHQPGTPTRIPAPSKRQTCQLCRT